jgi:hypothetical protein
MGQQTKHDNTHLIGYAAGLLFFLDVVVCLSVEECMQHTEWMLMIADAFVHAHLRVLTESGDGQQSIIYSEELP